jgi:hypothetical protein
MCATCKHWFRSASFVDPGGRRFAPCALKPDRKVKDSRVPGGKVPQEYVTSETYRCPQFAEGQQ